MKYIAHTSNREGLPQYLGDHLRNVSERMFDTLAPIGLSEMGRFIGLLHDVGKAQPDWQLYIAEPEKTKTHPGHSQYGRVAYNETLFPLDDAKLEIERDYRYTIAQVVYSHHSALHDDVDFDDMEFSCEENWQRDANTNCFTDLDLVKDCYADGCINLKDVQAAFQHGYAEFAKIWADIHGRNADHYKKDPDVAENAIAFELNLLNALLLSVLMDADWLDTQNHEDCIYLVEKQSVVDWNRFIVPFEKQMSAFSNDTFINEIRGEVSDACRAVADEDPDHGAYRLSVFCGGGKTLASTRYALHHANRWNKRHIYYVIPFTSIIEQNADVLRSFCQCGDEQINAGCLLEHHCNAGLDLNADISDITEAADGGAYIQKAVSRYDVPLIMTTQVRFLTTLFSKDKKSRRLLSDYIDSEIIFDEFQAMPIKLLDMFYIAVEFMVHIMHCNIVLCSATQAVPATYELSSVKYLTGIDWNEKYADELERAVFTDLSSYSNPQSPVMSLGDIGDLVESESSDGRSCLVIVNSRKQARELFCNLKNRLVDSIKIYHLSTNMYPLHRKDVLEKMMNDLEQDDLTVVCVSTSLIEAGIDVSFDTVIRYLNGFDSVVQSGGRCNRHAAVGMKGHVYIVNEPKALPMYKNQQDATGTVIMTYGKDLTNYLTAGLCKYYQDYISRISDKTTKFKYEHEGNIKYETTLTDLWGSNIDYVKHHPANLMLTASNRKMPLHHSLVRTAQRVFSVIESNQNEIIICNDKRCSELLDAYEQAVSFSVLIELQRQLQQYSVSLTKTDFFQVQNALIERTNDILNVSVQVLSWDVCYDEECGIIPVDDNDLII